MGVTIREYLRVKDNGGNTHEGYALAGDLVAIQSENGIVYGKPFEGLRIETTIVCDSGEKCTNATVNDEFKSVPKTISFTEDGSQNPEFIKLLSDIVITQDFNGKKLSFCSSECAASHLRRKNKDTVIEFPSGKGIKTSFQSE